MNKVDISVEDLAGTLRLGEAIGTVAKAGAVFELISDLGGGKTALTKGLARGVGVDEVVQSPTFTISRIYKADRGLELHHFDFYRLTEPGVMAAELAESLEQPNTVVVIEWGDIVHSILPQDRTMVSIKNTGETARRFTFEIPKSYPKLMQAVQQFQQTRHIA